MDLLTIWSLWSYELAEMTDLEELLLCMNELFALLHFTPHPLHFILMGLPWYHLLIRLQLIVHLRCLANNNIYS